MFCKAFYNLMERSRDGGCTSAVGQLMCSNSLFNGYPGEANLGNIGLLLMVKIIFLITNVLTLPLTYMNTVATVIIHFGDTSEDGNASEVDRKRTGLEVHSQNRIGGYCERVLDESERLQPNQHGKNAH